MSRTVSITTDLSLRYVEQDFGPPEHHPELRRYGLQSGTNPVYSAVRKTLAQAGLDRERMDTENWNPFGKWIGPGNRVFILPNLVVHTRQGESVEQFRAKCTNASVLRPVIDYALLANESPDRIAFGNAPLQSCDYRAVANETSVKQLAEEYRRQFGHLLGPYDLRAVVTRWNRFGALLEQEDRAVDDVSVDLGSGSFLDPLFRDGLEPRVRVGDYDPEDTMKCHAPGKHIYLINRRVLDADVIISVPKLKTHQKVGITCALKGLVGIVSHKECLAHHRRGGPDEGGDEYLRGTWLNRGASAAADLTSRHRSTFLWNSGRFLAKAGYRAARMMSRESGGGWYGNDTAWRMTLDLMYIIEHARADGTLSETPVRKHITLIDGIVAGEGEGPLRPEPKHCGTLIFSDDPVWGDRAAALLMGFEPDKLPLLRNAGVRETLNSNDDGRPDIILNGSPVSDPASLPNFHFETPRGWVSHMERTVSRCLEPLSEVRR